MTKKKIIGSEQRPRLIINKSNKNIYLQLIDDQARKTVVGVCVSGKNLVAAQKAGTALVQKAKKKGVEAIVLDRGRYLYHGVIRKISETIRSGGLKH